MAESLHTFPLARVFGRRYTWRRNGIIYAEGTLTGFNKPNGPNGFLALYGDGKTSRDGDDYMFGISLSQGTWREDGDDIILVPNDKEVGEFVFHAPRVYKLTLS